MHNVYFMSYFTWCQIQSKLDDTYAIASSTYRLFMNQIHLETNINNNNLINNIQCFVKCFIAIRSNIYDFDIAIACICST